MTTNAILTAESLEPMPEGQPKPPTQSASKSASTQSAAVDEGRWNAVMARDAARDGEFVFAVSSTGVYCRPSCPARRPRRGNVQFFSGPEQAERGGYRACLRCKPKSFSGNAESNGAKAICRFIEQHLDEPLTLERLGKEFRQSRFHLQRRFKAALGITPREYADSCRMRMLKRNLQAGDSVTRAMYDAGYGSSSRLYERTASQLGMTPDKYRRGAIAAAIRYTCADSPLGRMLIAATERGICAIQFARSDGELIEPPHFSAGCGRTCNPFPSGRRDPMARLPRQLASLAPVAPLPDPAPQTRSQSRFHATAWCARMAAWEAIDGAWSARRLCWRWSGRIRKRGLAALV
jgi:methylphosphotriester-DNA--protein-cysteine methyltransferase